MTGEKAPERQQRIDQIERECRSIEKKLAHLHNADLDTATRRYQDLRRELGGLLLARDKDERPHFYAKTDASEAKAPELPVNPECDTEDFHAGVDFAMELMCKFLRADPNSFSWDAATEEFEGDVMSVLGNMFEAAFGEDESPDSIRKRADVADAMVAAALAEAVKKAGLTFQDIGDGRRPPMPFEALLRDLEGYSQIMPSKARAQNVMRQAAKLLRALTPSDASVALAERDRQTWNAALAAVMALPKRQAFLGGQMHSYVRVEEIEALVKGESA